jgi:hypothetical protein
MGPVGEDVGENNAAWGEPKNGSRLVTGSRSQMSDVSRLRRSSTVLFAERIIFGCC